MIIGLVPVGGRGLRLGLPFSKELLPIIDKNYYPVIKCTIDKMREAGAELIVLVHGRKFKKDIVQYLKEKDIVHIKQLKPSFARVIVDCFNYCKKRKLVVSKVLFGLPDSYYSGNHFIKAVSNDCSTIILFNDVSVLKVDRLFNGKFVPKISFSKFNAESSKYFWGAFVLSNNDFSLMQELIKKNDLSEIGIGLNCLDTTSFIFSRQKYYDLGTWDDFKSFYKKQLKSEL